MDLGFKVWKIGYVREATFDLFGEMLLRFEVLKVRLLLIEGFFTSGFGLN